MARKNLRWWSGVDDFDFEPGLRPAPMNPAVTPVLRLGGRALAADARVSVDSILSCSLQGPGGSPFRATSRIVCQAINATPGLGLRLRGLRSFHHETQERPRTGVRGRLVTGSRQRGASGHHWHGQMERLLPAPHATPSWSIPVRWAAGHGAEVEQNKELVISPPGAACVPCESSRHPKVQAFICIAPTKPKASLIAWHSGAVSCAANHVASSMVKGRPRFEQTSLQA
jgi:hypothetical protein